MEMNIQIVVTLLVASTVCIGLLIFISSLMNKNRLQLPKRDVPIRDNGKAEETDHKYAQRCKKQIEAREAVITRNAARTAAGETSGLEPVPDLPPRFPAKRGESDEAYKIRYEKAEAEYQYTLERTNRMNRVIRLVGTIGYVFTIVITGVILVIGAIPASNVSKDDISRAIDKATTNLTQQIVAFKSDVYKRFDSVNEKFKVNDSRIARLEDSVRELARTPVPDQPVRIVDVDLPSTLVSNMFKAIEDKRVNDMMAISEENTRIKNGVIDALADISNRLERVEQRPATTVTVQSSGSIGDPAKFVTQSTTPTRISGSFSGPAGGSWFSKRKTVTVSVTSQGGVNQSDCDTIARKLHEELADKFSRKDPEDEKDQALFVELAHPILKRIMREMGYRETDYIGITFSNEDKVPGATNLVQKN